MSAEFQAAQFFLKASGIDARIADVLPEGNDRCLEWETPESHRHRIYKHGILINKEDRLQAYIEESLPAPNDVHTYYLYVVENDKNVFSWELAVQDKSDVDQCIVFEVV